MRELTSLQHPLVKHLVHLRQNRIYREEHQSVVVVGIKPVTEVSQKNHVKLLLAYDETFIPKGISADDIIIVNEEIMKKISGMEHPEGLLAEIAMPKMDIESVSLKDKKFIIVCDGVSDPGNLGNLLRTGLALGWEAAVMLGNSCDPFNDKALRAARGATFRLPIVQSTWKDLAKVIEKNGLQPIVADLDGTPLENVKFPKGVLLVLSNESHGVSDEAKQICKKVTIPMPGPMESLNVATAGAILMYAFRL